MVGITMESSIEDVTEEAGNVVEAISKVYSSLLETRETFLYLLDTTSNLDDAYLKMLDLMDFSKAIEKSENAADHDSLSHLVEGLSLFNNGYSKFVSLKQHIQDKASLNENWVPLRDAFWAETDGLVSLANRIIAVKAPLKAMVDSPSEEDEEDADEEDSE